MNHGQVQNYLGEKASNKGDSTVMSVLSRGSDLQMGREVEKKQLQTGDD